MAFSAISTKAYKDPLTVQFFNTIKDNLDHIYQEMGLKAWVVFDGSGVASAHDSFNITTLTRSGTGEFRVDFTTSFATTAIGLMGNPGERRMVGYRIAEPGATGSLLFQVSDDAGLDDDTFRCFAAFMGNQ